MAHLAELEERKLHTKDASESLFAHCTQRLGLSNSEAFHRITVARVARQFPVIFELLERRELHLTAVCLLRDYLTAENYLELLTEASHKTKWQVQELIARRFPRPDVGSSVRKLPARPLPTPALSAQSLPARSLPAQAVGAGVPSAPPVAAPPVVAPASVSPVAAQAAALAVIEKPIVAKVLIEPTSEARYRIQLNASSSLKKKLDQARALISHSNPSGDIAVVVERALDLLIEKVEKLRFGKTERPRQPRRALALGETAAQAGDSQAEPAEARKRRASIEVGAQGGALDTQSSDLFVRAKSLDFAARRARQKLGAKRAGLRCRAKAAERTREHIPNTTRRGAKSRCATACAVRLWARTAVAARRVRFCRSTMTSRGRAVAGQEPKICDCFVRLTISCWPSKTSARGTWLCRSRRDVPRKRRILTRASESGRIVEPARSPCREPLAP